ncbi:MAG: immunoglobulin domain-containing protein [Clostridia bacterium]|nr:immunoglobulin domain-containing protein [Clostridia bacterium]
MAVKKAPEIYKIMSILLALALIIGTVPFSGILSYAADGNFVIQYLENGEVQKGIDIVLTPDISLDESFSGTTNEQGVWETPVTWSDLAELMKISVDGNIKEINKSEEEKKYLIIDIGEETWSDNVADLSNVEISADKTDVYTGGSFVLSTVNVKGTPVSYQWYVDGRAIGGATSSTYKVDSANKNNSGNYYCRVEGPSTTLNSDKITINVTEKEISDAYLKAYANGNEITGSVNRDALDKFELRVEGIPDDAKVSAVKFYVNGECESSTNTELTYEVDVKDGVETYECKVVLIFDEKYAEKTLELSEAIQLDMLAQEAVTAEVSDTAAYNAETGEYEITYSQNPKATFDVTLLGGSGSGKYTLRITDEKLTTEVIDTYDGAVATCTPYSGENKWKITVNGAGTFNVEAGKEGDGDYIAAETVKIKVSVDKASADGFAFENAEPEAVTYNENNNEFINVIAGDFENVKYAIESGDCATIDENTGKLTITKAGTVVVTATKEETKNYHEMSASYTLTVNKAEQTIAFEDMAEKIYYGQSYIRTAAPVAVEGAADSYGYNAQAQVTYSIVLPEGETEAIAQVNEDGSLVFATGKTGAVAVKAELAGNDCYEASEASYSLIVEEYAIEEAYFIAGEKSPEENNTWYVGDIFVTPAEGHKISKSNSLDESNIWLDEIVISDEGAENGFDLYVKNVDTGAISKVYSVENEQVKLDKSLPESLAVRYKTQVWYEAALDTVTLGYYNSAVTFVLEAKDSVSGIKSFIWKFTAEDNAKFSVNKTEIQAQKVGDIYQSEECVLGDEESLEDFRGKLSFVAVDNAGNEEEYEGTYVVVVDATDPELSITTDIRPVSTVSSEYPFDNADENSVNPVEIYKDGVTVNFSIIEKNFFADRVVVTVNDEDVTDKLSWIDSGDNHISSMKLEESGDYTITLSYKNIFGENPEFVDEKTLYKETKIISIDKEAAVISISLKEENFSRENKKYYNSDVVAEITVNEAKFRPFDISVSMFDDYIALNEEQLDYLKNSKNWTLNEQTGAYSISLHFNALGADGEYKFSVGYTDLAGNISDAAESGVFVIDTQKPELSLSNDTEAKITVENLYPYNGADSSTENPIEIYSEDTTVTFTVTDNNFFADRAEITVNGEDVSTQISWESVGNKHTASLTFAENGDYDIGIKYTDIFDDPENGGNKAVYTASKVIAVDKEIPEITVTLSEHQNIVSDTKYYNTDVKADIFVKDAKFRPSDFVVSDIEGFKGISDENKAYLGLADSWTYNAEKKGYSTSIIFKSTLEGGNYRFALDYTDLVGNVAKQAVSDLFVIDNNKPVVTADYGNASILDSENNVIASFTPDETNNVTVFHTEGVTVTFKIDEHNFDSENVVLYLAKDGAEYVEHNFDGEWISEGITHTNTVTVEEKGSYAVKVVCKDICTNTADRFVSPRIVVDDTLPSISYSIDAEGSYYYDDDSIDVTINVFDDRFNAERISLDVNARDISGETVKPVEIIPEITDNSNWAENSNDLGAKYYSYTFTLSTEALYVLTAAYKDAVGNERKETNEFVIDRTGPENLTIEYSESVFSTIISTLTFNYYNAPVIIKLKAQDNISGVKQFDWEYTKEQGASDINVETQTGLYVYDDPVKDGEYEFSLPEGSAGVIMLSELEQYRGSISFKATDTAGNVSLYGESGEDTENVIIVDSISPTREVEYSAAARVVDETSYYNTAATATIKITEANFYPDDVSVKINETDSNVEWTQSGDVWTGEIVLSDTGDYIISLNYKDRSGNQMVEYVSNKIVIDNTDPVVSVTYSPRDVKEEIGERKYFAENQTATIRITEHNFDSNGVVISVTATDALGNTVQAAVDSIKSQLDNLKWSSEGDIHTATVVYSVDANYTFDIECTDYAARKSENYKADFFTVDKTAPEISYELSNYDKAETQKDEDGNVIKKEVLSTSAVKVTLKAKDDISPIYSIAYNYVNSEDGDSFNKTVENTVSESENKMSNEMEIEFDVPYVDGNADKGIEFEGRVNFSVDDYAHNNSGEKTTEEYIIVDNVAPELSSEFGGVVNKDEAAKDTEYPVVGLGVVINVREANFDASALEFDFAVTDIGNNKVEFEDEEIFKTYLKKQSNWETKDNLNWTVTVRNLTQNTDGIEATLPDGKYFIKVAGEDRLGNVAESDRVNQDGEFERVTGLEIGYFLIDTEAPINLSIKYSTPKLQKIISAITFNYYNAPVVVTLYAEDSTSGVKRFEWTYTRESGASDTNVATYNGFHEFSNSEIPDKVDLEKNRESTIDITIPENKGSREQFRGNISFKAIDRGNNESEIFADKKNVIVVDTKAPEGTVTFSDPKSGSWEEGNTAYYDSDATATVVIKEANFYPEDVDLKVNDGPYDNVTWIKSGQDEWTGTVEFTEDGEYILSVKYADRSTNAMKEYVSGEIVIDEYAPEIEISYAPDKEVYTSDGIKYYSEDQTATIRITEHNFDPNGVEPVLTATDIDGKEIAVNDIVSHLTSSSAWRSDGDVHTATVVYSKDANYTFDIKCTDSSGNVGEIEGEHKFSVDKSAPSILSVNIRDKSVYADESAEYYNNTVVVSVSAKDLTSGVASFNYSYTDEITGKTYTGKADAVSTGGSGASATFKLPSEGGDFNGTIRVAALDNSGNRSTEYKDKKVIVVDGTAPEGEIDFTTQPVTNAGKLYYSGNVTAEISIKETNFSGEDVVVTVDGNRADTGNWSAEGDRWVSSVVVSADGEHKIVVEYTDKSGNQMERKESDSFVIDHTAPVVVLRGIKNESANNEEKIGFTLTAEDSNFSAGGFAPVLTVVKNKNNSFQTETIDLTSEIASSNGYSISVDNLTEDGIYTLTCTASDLCGNSTKTMIVSDSGNTQVETLRFSVNRNGSVYALDKASKAAVDKYYNQKVDGDIVITEVNVSAIEDYSIKLNNKTLTEDVDYSVIKNGNGKDEWFRNEYVIKSSLFEKEGSYNIIVGSKDSTGSSYYSDMKDVAVSFVVDKTTPSVSVSGIEKGEVYETDKQMISIMPNDDISELNSLKVVVEDNSGEIVSVLFEAEGSDLQKLFDEAEGVLNLEVGEGINQNVRIVCEDKAGNVYDSVEEFSGITVSSNKAVILLSSTGFKIGVGAAVVLAAGLIFFIIAKKRKKKEA